MLKRVIARGALPKSLEVVPLHSVSKKGKIGPVEASESNVKSILDESRCLTANFCVPKVGAGGVRGDEYDDVDLDKREALRLPYMFKDVSGNVLVDSERKRLFAAVGEKPTVRDYRLSVTSAVREAVKLEASSLVLGSLPSALYTVGDLFQPQCALPLEDVVEKTVTYAVTAAYQYDRLLTRGKGDKDDSSRGKKKGTVGKDSQGSMKILIDCRDKTSVASGNIIGRCVNDARNLGNLREDEGTPQFYCEWIHQELVPLGVKVRSVLQGEQLEKAGLNLIYNVGKGSKHAPYLVVFEYVGDRGSNKATALVGKGVTFDCGGLNIKPFGSMEAMHMDMMGAAAVISTMKAIAELQLPVNVVAAVGLVENAIGPSSYHPSCILTSRKGLSVEVLNTDAEGRLVLADTLTFLQKDARLVKKADTIIDVATLTGAIVVGLGNRRAGLFGNDIALVQQLMASGRSSGEEVWPMPIGEEHQKAIKGNIADLVNVSAARGAGSCTAAAFLSNFVEKNMKWAHVDIAGPGMGTDKPEGFQPAGAPGFGVELLVNYFRQHVMASSKVGVTVDNETHDDKGVLPLVEEGNTVSGEGKTEGAKPGATGKKRGKTAKSTEGKGRGGKASIKGKEAEGKTAEKRKVLRAKVASPLSRKARRAASTARGGRPVVKSSTKGKKQTKSGRM